MSQPHKASAFILGLFIAIGLTSLGWMLNDTLIKYKQYDRSVTVKGLAEREVYADIVIWPIQFVVVGNDLEGLYNSIENSATQIKTFLSQQGIQADGISFSAPAITDKSVYDNNRASFRYSAQQTVTVYSDDVSGVRKIMGRLLSLGKKGIVFTGNDYNAKTEYIFTGLNNIKPAMIEEATKQAREVAQKFAADSDSKLGKIKRATQGQFSISARDTDNPHIKNVRVVSTVEYYLTD
ncbi:hypothetical protein SAMN02745127_01633 [Oceanospirillum multiglobuliferum]|uniref:SIMPL domain-containing protein n=1 Tax=Oceanospirillum multiglobuliferum TaxID=64969 RepID=A0A1T4PUD8_9GAMM|nr:SIMPL domain-containing protein [Oceanospirillum multiglobuliferum]OPX55315.1 hypothetical protein BTE48_09095 [Oceanospirillum multiglobuliferum]SJZ95059.1 hypothetical protein SAMN02745127_01633 [Oceanospirillum multiglobuliferum]